MIKLHKLYIVDEYLRQFRKNSFFCIATALLLPTEDDGFCEYLLQSTLCIALI